MAGATTQGNLEERLGATVRATLSGRGFEDEDVAAYITGTLAEVVASAKTGGRGAAASLGDATDSLSEILVRPPPLSPNHARVVPCHAMPYPPPHRQATYHPPHRASVLPVLHAIMHAATP